MFFEHLWSNVSYLLSYVDPIVNRNVNSDVTLWQGFLNFIYEVSNKAYVSIAAQVDMSNYVEHFSNVTMDILAIAKNATKTIGINIFTGDFNSVLSVLTFELDRTMNWFNFSDFQYRLLREFSLILAGNIFLVLVAWKVYGPRISARFLARSTSGGSHKRIAELRTSMSELQLPNELDFKFK